MEAMADAHPIGNDRIGPVAEWPRGSDATLLILVQVQAGSPRFALTGCAWQDQPGKRVGRS